MKRSVAKCVSDRASNSGTIFAAEQDCYAPLLKVECPALDRFLKRSGPILNTFIGAEISVERLAELPNQL